MRLTANRIERLESMAQDKLTVPVDADKLIMARYNELYDWQYKFIYETNYHLACLLMAANRVGKTYTGCLIDAFHATGLYPDDWEGHKFDHAPLIWILGFSGEKIRDIIQAPLFGTYSNGSLSGGLIPKELIIDAIPMMGTPRAVREVKIKHPKGVARIQLWSYSQGQHALMGDSVDWYHIDEEPKDETIYPQVLTRTATGDNGKGGRGILTFTPENGRTELVISFMDKPSPSMYMQRATWDDAEHLTQATKEALLSMYPSWQRDMRTKGLPLLGTGLIFDLDMESCKVKAFEIPDFWLTICAMDFGWDHPQAHVKLVIDPDTETVYLVNAWKASKTLAYEAWEHVKPWAKGVPTAWPADGFQTEKGTGKTQKSYYEDAGWSMLDKQATWPDGGNSVEQGLIELYRLIDLGKFKIFSHLSEVFEEFQQYHRDENGRIVKIKDDILDAIRYAYMMRREAIPIHEVGGAYYDEYQNSQSDGWL